MTQGAPAPLYKILLVDDNAIFREALKALMSPRPELAVVGEAGSGENAVALVKELKPDLVVMDINMPGQGGLLTTKQIKDAYPDVRVLILSGSDDDSNLYRAIENGAQGYLLKMAGSRDLLGGILSAARGEAVFSPGVASKALTALGGRGRTGGGQSLSLQEREVLGLISRGYTNAKIGDELSLSESAVSLHLRDILQKLHVTSRDEAAIAGHIRGYDR